MEVGERRFRVMASECQLLALDASPAILDRARERLEHLERRWSRFIPTSDITRLNTNTGRSVQVDADTIVLLDAMLAARRATGGAYDPTVLPTLVASGYATSIVDPTARTVLPPTTTGATASGVDLERVVVHRAARSITLPLGVALDPGGIGKGLAADLVVAQLLVDGAAGALVSIGGDLAVGGASPAGEGWRVVVEDPFDPNAELVTLALDVGGVCTSSTRSRRWMHDGHVTHHVIDPVTRRTATIDVVSATVVAGAGWLAEAHATEVLLAGSAGALDVLDRNGLAGAVTMADGRTILTADLLVGAL